MTMGLNDEFPYSPLTTDTQIRVIVLAPGKGDDPIHCFRLVIDLDADWELHGRQSRLWPSAGQNRVCYMEVKTTDGELLRAFTVPTLRFHPEKDDGLHSFQRYSALSYVWGDQSNPYKIFLDGMPFDVGHNLYMALRRLRRRIVVLDPSREDLEATTHHMLPEGRVLWIDAICINQANIAEREAQVKLMARVYKQADHVHADLGYPGESGGLELLRLCQAIINAGIACDSHQPSSSSSQPGEHLTSPKEDGQIMSALESQWQNYETEERSHIQSIHLPSPATRSLEDQGIPPEDDPIWAQWRLFLDSRYFQRLWIVQEFSLAKTITLWFANISIEPEMVSDCIGLLNTYSINRGFYYFPKDSSEAAAKDSTSLSGFVDMMHHRRLMHVLKDRGTNLSCLLDMLRYARRTAATDLRDKIYGMLGLASDGPDFYHLVSYSKSVEATYEGFARCFVEKGQGIEMLYQIDSRMSKTLDIPTWVPDWSRSMDESSITGNFDTYATGKTEPPKMHCFDSKLLVNGVMIDTVNHTTRLLPHAFMKVIYHDVLGFLREGGRLLITNEPPVDGNMAMELVLQTILCDSDRGSKSPTEVNRIRRSMWAIFGHGIFLASEGNSATSTWLPHMRNFIQDGLLNAAGRSWCTTENGYFGLVPGGTKKGDRVAMLCGGPFPFIVRPLSEEENTEYTLVGHGYFHDPRIWESCKDGDFGNQSIVLV